MTIDHHRGDARDDGDPRGHRARRDGRGDEDRGFTCIHCRTPVARQAWGTCHRNHCPLCLWSRHVDEHPGDRAALCRKPMEPIGIEVRHAGEWALIHRCTGCGALRANRIAGDDSERSLLALALRPIARPAFPLDDVRT